MHFGCISLARDPLRTKLLRLLDQVEAAGKRVSYDPNFRNIMTAAYDPTLRHIAARADVIKVSDEDLVGLFRTSDPAEGFAQLRAINPTAPILLTVGVDGAELHLAASTLTQRPPRIEVVDTVGAGDASIGGLLYSLMSPEDGWATHLRFSVAAGAAAACGPVRHHRRCRWSSRCSNGWIDSRHESRRRQRASRLPQPKFLLDHIEQTMAPSPARDRPRGGFFISSGTTARSTMRTPAIW